MSRDKREWLLLMLVNLVLCLLTAGCPGEAKTPRENARAVVLTTAEGVRAGDLACAATAKAKGDLALAETCAAAVKEAREALLAAEAGVDAWDAAAQGKVPCAVAKAGAAVSKILDAIKRAGGQPPGVLEDALKLAPVLLGGCHA